MALTAQRTAKPGDIILYRATPSTHIFGRFVVWGQRLLRLGMGVGDYYHASIVSGDTDFQIEATWPHVRISQIPWKKHGLELWRIKGIRSYKRPYILMEAYGHVGEWYDLVEIFFGALSSTRLRVCSSLVSGALRAVGYVIQSKDGRITPNMLAAYKHLIRLV